MNHNNTLNDLGYHLNHTFTALVCELNHALQAADLPLNHSQFSILQALSRSGIKRMSQREIAAELGKDPAAISRALNYLEDHGFIERFPLSGCKNGVALTQKAISLQPKIEKIIHDTIAKACRGMSTDMYQTGILFLNKIYTSLKMRDE